MASSINASLTAGLVSTADTSGIINLQSGGTTVATISSTGLATTGVMTSSSDATISGLTVGKGGGAVATNTAVGVTALAANTTGAQNTTLGYQAGYSNTSGYGSTFLGYQSGYSNTTGAGSDSNHVAVGRTALYSNTTGQFNTAIGYSTLYSNTTASNNTAVGYQAGYSNSTGSDNTFLGKGAGYGSANGYNGNTAIGFGAGGTLGAGGNYNTFLGVGSGGAVTTGASNTIIGAYSGNQGGLDIRTSSNNIVLSDGAGNPRAFYASGYSSGWTFSQKSTPYVLNASECVQIDATHTTYGLLIAAATSSTMQRYYNTSTSTIVGSVTISSSATAYNTSSDYRLKENIAPMVGALATISALKPVTYNWKTDGSDGQGFIAHELAEVVPDCVTGTKDAVDADGNPQYQGIDTSFLVATLVAAIQELKAEIDLLKGAK